MKDVYKFVAVFEYADDGINIYFPDIEHCFTCADTTEEGLIMAKDVLEETLYFMEKKNQYIPKPTPITEINKTLEKDKIPFLITAHMVLVRDALDNRSIKKTLTIPRWLNELGEENNVNFSLILQNALKEHLCINKKI